MFQRKPSAGNSAFGRCILPPSAIYEYFLKKKKKKTRSAPPLFPTQFQMAEHFSQEQDLDQDTVLRHHVGNPSTTDAECQSHAWGKTDAEAEIPVLWPPDVKN